MLVRLSDDRYLVVNEVSGATIVAPAAWWRAVGFGPGPGSGFRPDVVQHGESVAAQCRPTEAEHQLLHTLGFLANPVSEAAYHERHLAFADTKRLTRPLCFFITPQLACPLACVYCFEQLARAGAAKIDTALLGNVERVVEFIENRRVERGVPPDRIAVALFGGEPLLPYLRAFNTRLLEHVAARGYRWRVNTSGATLDDGYLQLIKKYRDSLQEVDITLDGPPSVHNRLRPFKSGAATFSHIKRAIDLLLEAGVRVMIKTNLGTATAERLENFLDLLVSYGWFRSESFLFTTNMVRRFGGTATGEQYCDEDHLTVRLVEVFKRKPYESLLPKVRFEGLRVTEYLANALRLLTVTEASGAVLNKFDGYPRFAFCHPGEGTAMNISYDGQVYVCNWMAGKPALSIGSIFDNPPRQRLLYSQQTATVSSRSQCNHCDLSALCGGGCSLERDAAPDFYDSCRDYFGSVLQRFVDHCQDRNWISPDLGASRMVVLRESFDFEYRYEDRTRRWNEPRREQSHGENRK
jgi:uncharacterized protein